MNIMRFRTAYMAIAAFMLMLLPSCGDEPAHIDNSGTDGSMSVKDELVFDGNTTLTLSVRAKSKPTLSCDAEWLHIGEVKSMAVGIYTSELTVDVNDTGETRSASILVTAGKESSTIAVTQTFCDIVRIKAIHPQGDLDPAGGSLTITYDSTGVPAVNIPEWMRVVETKSITEGTLTLSYESNNTGNARSGLVVLAVGKDAVANVDLLQPSR